MSPYLAEWLLKPVLDRERSLTIQLTANKKQLPLYIWTNAKSLALQNRSVNRKKEKRQFSSCPLKLQAFAGYATRTYNADLSGFNRLGNKLNEL